MTSRPCTMAARSGITGVRPSRSGKAALWNGQITAGRSKRTAPETCCRVHRIRILAGRMETSRLDVRFTPHLESSRIRQRQQAGVPAPQTPRSDTSTPTDARTAERSRATTGQGRTRTPGTTSHRAGTSTPRTAGGAIVDSACKSGAKRESAYTYRLHTHLPKRRKPLNSFEFNGFHWLRE